MTGIDLRAIVRELRRPVPAERRGRLAARIRDEQPPVARRDAHAGERIGNAGLASPLLEAEAQPGRIRLGPARPGDVDVELVWILVVGDVHVGTPVAVHVHELHAEPVPEGARLEARGNARLVEPPAAVVQEQQVADARDVRRETGERAGNGIVRVGIARGEEIGTTVAVHICGRDARVPPVRGKRCRAELPAVVPEHVDAGGRRDREICASVSV